MGKFLEGEKYGAHEEIATIAAFMGGKSLFVRPKEKQYEADAAHSRFKHPNSDFLSLLSVWKEYNTQGKNQWQWCKENYINGRTLNEVKKIRLDLLSELRKMDIYSGGHEANEADIRKAITSGMIERLLMYGGDYSYTNLQNNNSGLYIHPSSTQFHEKPKMMVAGSIMETSRTFASMCQAIGIEDIKDFASHLIVSEVNLGQTPLTSLREQPTTKIEYALRGGYQHIEERELYGEEAKREVLRYYLKNKTGRGVFEAMPIVIDKLEDLYLRSGGDQKYKLLEEEYLDIFMGKFGGLQIETIDDYTNIPDNTINSIKGSFSLSDFNLSNEEMDGIYEKSPERITSGEREYTLTYKELSGEKIVAEVAVDEESDIENFPVLESGIPYRYIYNGIACDTKESLYVNLAEQDIKKQLEKLLSEGELRTLSGAFNGNFALEHDDDFDLVERNINKKAGMVVDNYTHEEKAVYTMFKRGSWSGKLTFSLTLDMEEADREGENFAKYLEGFKKEVFQLEYKEELSELSALSYEIGKLEEELLLTEDKVEEFREKREKLYLSKEVSSLQEEMNDYFLGLKKKQAEVGRGIESGEILREFGGHFRRMGAANNEDLWVIDSDGNMVKPNEIEYRKRYTEEGDKTWLFLKSGHIALQWYCAKIGDIIGTSTFSVEKLPVGGVVTDAQLKAIGKIEQEDIGTRKGSFGLHDDVNIENERFIEEVIDVLKGSKVLAESWNTDELEILQVVGKWGQCVEGGDDFGIWYQNTLGDVVIDGREAKILEQFALRGGILEVLIYEKYGTEQINIRFREKDEVEKAAIKIDDNGPTLGDAFNELVTDEKGEESREEVLNKDNIDTYMQTVKYDASLGAGFGVGNYGGWKKLPKEQRLNDGVIVYPYFELEGNMVSIGWTQEEDEAELFNSTIEEERVEKEKIHRKRQEEREKEKEKSNLDVTKQKENQLLYEVLSNDLGINLSADGDFISEEDYFEYEGKIQEYIDSIEIFDLPQVRTKLEIQSHIKPLTKKINQLSQSMKKAKGGANGSIARGLNLQRSKLRQKKGRLEEEREKVVQSLEKEEQNNKKKTLKRLMGEFIDKQEEIFLK